MWTYGLTHALKMGQNIWNQVCPSQSGTYGHCSKWFWIWISYSVLKPNSHCVWGCLSLDGRLTAALLGESYSKRQDPSISRVNKSPCPVYSCPDSSAMWKYIEFDYYFCMFLKEPYGALVQTNIFSLRNLGKKLPVIRHLALHLALSKARGRGLDTGGTVRLRWVAWVQMCLGQQAKKPSRKQNFKLGTSQVEMWYRRRGDGPTWEGGSALCNQGWCGSDTERLPQRLRMLHLKRDLSLKGQVKPKDLPCAQRGCGPARCPQHHQEAACPFDITWHWIWVTLAMWAHQGEWLLPVRRALVTAENLTPSAS